jgi:hypothetical protein
MNRVSHRCPGGDRGVANKQFLLSYFVKSAIVQMTSQVAEVAPQREVDWASARDRWQHAIH